VFVLLDEGWEFANPVRRHRHPDGVPDRPDRAAADALRPGTEHRRPRFDRVAEAAHFVRPVRAGGLGDAAL
jgi:hypothetical protein